MQLFNFSRKSICYTAACVLAIAGITSCNSNSSTTMKREIYEWPNVPAPVAEKKPKELNAHGDIRQDPYYWMNDYFKKGSEFIKELSPEQVTVMGQIIPSIGVTLLYKTVTNKFAENIRKDAMLCENLADRNRFLKHNRKAILGFNLASLLIIVSGGIMLSTALNKNLEWKINLVNSLI